MVLGFMPVSWTAARNATSDDCQVGHRAIGAGIGRFAARAFTIFQRALALAPAGDKNGRSRDHETRPIRMRARQASPRFEQGPQGPRLARRPLPALQLADGGSHAARLGSPANARRGLGRRYFSSRVPAEGGDLSRSGATSREVPPSRGLSAISCRRCTNTSSRSASGGWSRPRSHSRGTAPARAPARRWSRRGCR